MSLHLIRITLLTFLGMAFAACSDNGAPGATSNNGVATNGSTVSPWTLVESVARSGDEIVIPYNKYRHQNGLTLVLHKDNSDPIVHVNITYHVGSAREQPHRSGFAHFFEHMMFQGSAHVGDDEHFAIVTEAGGRLNGSTSADRTNYYQTVPSNQLETILWLEADRMGFLLDAVTQEKFEIQRDTVKNERGQNVENRPYGLAYEQVIAALYPAGHPYSWPVIGYPADLDAATLDDLRHFFLRWYGPNNAVLIVAGNFDEPETLTLVDKYFGSIPIGPAVARQQVAAVTLDADRYISYEDKNIRFPLLSLVFPSVAYASADRVALNALGEILGGGKRSPLYKQFVLTQRAVDVSADNSSSELAGMFSIDIRPYPGADLGEFEGDIRSILANFNESSITQDDIDIYKGNTASNLVNGLASVAGKASRMASYEYLLENPDNIRNELAAVRNLTAADVLRVFNQYVKNKPMVIQSVLPAAMPGEPARPDNYQPLPAYSTGASDLDNLEPRPVADNFDRSEKPAPGPAPLLEVPRFWVHRLDNDAVIIGTRSEELPLVTLRLEFAGGHLLEQPAQYGLANLTAQMMNEGTEQLTAEAFEMELEKLGSRIRVSGGNESTQIYVDSLRENIDATLALLQQRLFDSRFTQEDLDRIRQQQIESIEAARQQPNSIANEVYNRLLYGEAHSMAVPSRGTVESLSAITLNDVQSFAAANLAADTLQMVVVGDIGEEDILRKLSYMERLPQSTLTMREQPATTGNFNNTLYLVDKPGLAQSEIRIGYLTELTYDATGEFYRRELMNYVLGSAFSSRINLNLREDKGYTYGARSNFNGSLRPGPFTASASVRTDATADSVRQFVNEIRAYREGGITDQDVAFTQAAVGQRDALNYETPGQKAGFLGEILEFDLPADFTAQQRLVLDAISREEMQRLAREHLPLEDMLILVVGDKEKILPSLEVLGYPIVEISANNVSSDSDRGR